MQIIRTKYIGPGSVRGSRITATTTSGIRKTFPYQHSKNPEQNHTEAARALAASLGWSGNWQGGDDKAGMVFVVTDGVFSDEARFTIAKTV